MTSSSLSWTVHGDSTSTRVIILVGGSGDDKHSFNLLVERMAVSLPQYRILTLSFSGVESHNDLPLHTQCDDLATIVDQEMKDPRVSLVLIATSQGAYSTVHILCDLKYASRIKRCILVDPADYSIDVRRLISQARSWSGFEDYIPSRETVSVMMKRIVGNVKVYVIHFVLRNYDKSGYGDPKQRGMDNPQKSPRLNSKMVKSFYINTPERNKGTYCEDKTLPHAFMRDGNIAQNIKTLADYFKNILSDLK